MNVKFFIIFLLLLDVALLFYLAVTHGNPAQMMPAGPIAQQEKNLLVFAFLLAMIVILPVFALFLLIATRYHEGKKRAYLPDWTPPNSIRLLWWAIPAVFMLILAVRTWHDTHALDPYRPLTAAAKPVRIQVVALRWKWLFIYPEERIATVNYIQFPAKTPVNFELTADAPMNSFWIPRLSGQIYAMTGMSTKIHVLADKTGDYPGLAAEISGIGFSGMRFIARASTEQDYRSWVTSVQQSPKTLTRSEYERLVNPSENTPAAYYQLGDQDLYNEVINKFMPKPDGTEHDMMPGMKM
jgi:cytochrome o ubiquinol oxidase subunit II